MGVIAPLRMRERKPAPQALRSRAALRLCDADSDLAEARTALRALWEEASSKRTSVRVALALDSVRRAELAIAEAQREIQLMEGGGEA